MSESKWKYLCELIEQPAKDERFNWTTTRELLTKIWASFEELHQTNAQLLPPDSPYYLPLVVTRTAKKLLRIKGIRFTVVVQQFTLFIVTILEMMGGMVQEEKEIPFELAREYTHLLRVILEGAIKDLIGPKDLYQKYKNLVKNYGMDMAEGMREFLIGISPPSAAILVSPAARQLVRGDKVIQECARATRFLEKPRMIYQLAGIIDEEITVLYPAQNKGWHIDVGGIATNTQLYALITNALQTNDKSIGGPLIPTRGVKIFEGQGPQTLAGLFYIYSLTMANWTILQKTTTYPLENQGASHWLWDDGVPSEISAFKGRRIIVVDKSKMPKKMDIVRVFPKIKAHATVKKTMTEDEVKALVAEIVATPRKVRDEVVGARAWVYNKAE